MVSRFNYGARRRQPQKNGYLVELSCRLGFQTDVSGQAVVVDYTELAAGLQALMRSLRPEP